MTGNVGIEDLDNLLNDYLAAVTPLLRHATLGIQLDVTHDHDQVWLEALQRLMRVRTPVLGTVNTWREQLRHIPALMLLRSAGVVALQIGRDDLFLRLLHGPYWRDHQGAEPLPAVKALQERDVLPDPGAVKSLPRWGERPAGWLYPASLLMRVMLRDELTQVLGDDEVDYSKAHGRYEYRLALAQSVYNGPGGSIWPTPGEFMLDSQWPEPDKLWGEDDFRAFPQQFGDDGPWWTYVGTGVDFGTTLLHLRARLLDIRSD